MLNQLNCRSVNFISFLNFCLRDLLTYVEWDINNIASNSDLKNCHLLLLEHLPNGIYVDPDQIRSGEEFGGPQVRITCKYTVQYCRIPCQSYFLIVTLCSLFEMQ